MKPLFTPGVTVAGYRVESLVGRGGMGVVYRATDLSLERPVALKLIAPELADDEHFRSRFLREPRLAASLDHPNVIPIYEAGERDGQLYLAMRYVEGNDLGSVLERDGRLAPERSLRILAQVAGALDAAHRHGLVHRDVKPANVLLDEGEHVYLTDFGITKQVGGASTDTGRVVGTLDYLAPEQIRGEEVDARTDCYALGCVLYECLAGAPPFRRATDAETLWAHMQEEPPPLPGYPALDPVLRRALAKGRDKRYAGCAELIEAAGQALGLAAPRAPRRRLVPPKLRRNGRAILAGGLLLLGAVLAAMIVALTRGGGAQVEAVGNGVAAIDGAGGELASFTDTRTAPSNLAVGEGAVWVLSLEDRAVARIDPETKAVVKKFRTRRIPTDIAAGGGALWIGNGIGPYTGSISRVDPRTGGITRTVKLRGSRGGDLGFLNWGFPQLAFGAGALWAVNADRTVSRIDPETGRIVATIEVSAATVAAGKEGVWFIGADDPQAVTRIDPVTNRVGQTIRVGTHNLSGIAVGAGSVWASAEGEGLVWRIEPGRRAVTRTIDVGVGVTFVAYGTGAVWTANYVDGKVSRIDPRTNGVDTTSVDAVQALAAGAGSAWVSTAGAATEGGFPASSCGALESRTATPDVLVASDLPLQGTQGAGPRAMDDAIRMVLRQRGFRAGSYTVGYRSCDDSTAQAGIFDRRRCAANANAYARAEDLVAVIGTYNSFCAQIEIPILNRAPGGPLAMISPANTYAGLTRRGLPPPWGYRGEPDVFYPTGRRSYMRVVALDNMHGAAFALFAKQRGLKGVYVLDDGSGFWKELLTNPFRFAARKLGVDIAGSASFDPEAKSYAALADKVAGSGAQGVVLGGDPYDGGDRLLKAVRARLGSRVTIMAGFAFADVVPDVLERTGSAAHGLYVTTSDLPRAELELTPAGRRFVRDFAAGDSTGFVLEAAQAAELVMRAIARSDGTRASVLKALRASRVRNGLLGSFRFDHNGDVVPALVPILRIKGTERPGDDLGSGFEGAALDQVVEIPRRLLR
jgi:ABC-type branched-subunit amino acid transport system substrate-binding protein/streptogramin lyase